LFDETNMASDRGEADSRMRKFHSGWVYHQAGKTKVRQGFSGYTR